MKSIQHLFRRFLQKSVIRVIKYLDYDRQSRSLYEKDCLLICNKMILREDSNLLMTPISNKRYIKNDVLGIFIVIDGSLVNVINHKYSYTVQISEKTRQTIQNLFNDKIELQRKKMEDEITKNIKHSLKTIAHSLD